MSMTSGSFFAYDNMDIKALYDLFLTCTGVSTDSRKIKKDEMFFALHGENFDGNIYAIQALEAGAKYAVVDDPSVVTDNCILVDDCQKQLQELATFHRKKTCPIVIAITGTNGKTTTKELLTAVLSTKYKVHATKGNLNNQLGVPLTILSAPSDTEILIVEMGASHKGDIDELCKIAYPDFGIITNIGVAHIQGFGSFEGVVETKTELYRFIADSGIMVFYDDNDHELVRQVYRSKVKNCKLSSVRNKSLQLFPVYGKATLGLMVEYGGVKQEIQTNLFGAHNLANAKAAIAIGLWFYVDINDALKAISGYVPSNNRSQVLQTKHNRLICDAYNANPSSMRKAIDAFASLEADNKMCVLGDMRELGPVSEQEHKAILQYLEDHNLKNNIFIGPEFKKVVNPQKAKVYSNTSYAIRSLKRYPIKNATLLLKGSRGIGLEKLYDYL